MAGDVALLEEADVWIGGITSTEPMREEDAKLVDSA